MIDIASFGAHILSATAIGPAREMGEIFWLSTLTTTAGPRAIRGGVPVIAPQFADLMDGPKHGWARVTPWEVVGEGVAQPQGAGGSNAGVVRASVSRAHVEHDGLALELLTTSTEQGIDVVLSAVNVSEKEARIQLGLHPYFRVGDVEKLHVTGLDGADLYDRAQDAHTVGTAQTTFRGEFDRICRGAAETVSIIDPVVGRRMDVRGIGNDAFVVWNPGEQLAATISDIHPGGWREFLCVEPTLVGPSLDGRELAPGARAGRDERHGFPAEGLACRWLEGTLIGLVRVDESSSVGGACRRA